MSWATASGTIVVWMLILAFCGWLVLRNDEAVIMMQIKQHPQLVVSGVVTFEGKPVTTGTVRLAFDDTKTGQHLASDVLNVKHGVFTTNEPSLSGPAALGQLRVSALFVGQYADAKQEIKSVEAQEIIYTNCAPPFSEKSLALSIVAIAGVVLALIVIFTGNFTRTSAAFLFGSAYLFTILSVTLPIVGLLFASRNHYLLETMKGSPIGIVVAKTKALAEPQWLLNVGGVLVEEPVGPSPAVATSPTVPVGPKIEGTNPTATAAATEGAADVAEPEGKASGAPTTPEITTVTAETAASANPVAGPPAVASSSAASTVALAVAIVPEASKERAAPTAAPTPAKASLIATVHGGLAIPFYVIVLAIFGAGLKMMRRVPQIQADHALSLPVGKSAGQMMAQAVGLHPAEQQPAYDRQVQATCDIRKAVIEQYMYLLSAPFLAIAVYYLLQILAANISEPVLVLMAFSAGLVSESIVSAVIQFAEKTLGRGTQPPSDDERETKAQVS